MPDISVPGIKSRFDTEKIVEGLMRVERLPKERIERTNEALASQKTNWQDLGRRITRLQESVRLLYSYQNPFNDKSAVSGNEAVLGAAVSREADSQRHEFVVKRTASADRFLSKPLDNDFRVPEGNYAFSTGQFDVSIKFRGGSLQEFVDAVNRGGQDSLKAGTVAVRKGQKSLLLESLVTGAENRLSFSGDALKLALDTGIVERQGAAEPKTVNIKAVAARGGSSVIEAVSGDGLTAPPMSNASVSLGDVTPTRTMILRFETAVVPAGPAALSVAAAPAAEDTVAASSGEDAAQEVASANSGFPPQPAIPAIASDGNSVIVDGKYVIQRQRLDGVAPDGTDVSVPEPEAAVAEAPPAAPQPATAPALPTEPSRADNLAVLSLEFSDGTSVALPPINDGTGFSSNQYQLYRLAEGRNVTGININNDNTRSSVSIRNIQLFDPSPPDSVTGGVKPLNPVSEARDAVILIDGIEISRPSNKIDDLVPGLTLNVRAASETPVSLDVETDSEAVKDAVITFVGSYNQLMAELNVLTRNDESVIRELSYLSAEEQEELRGRLGAFSTDGDLVRLRGRLQQIVTSPYADSNGRELLLSSFGIMTDARRGGGYDPSKMRGYLEIDEPAFDEALKTRMGELRQIFGRDSDGDLIIDTGLAYALNQTVQPYSGLGGVIAAKTAGIDSRIDSNSRRIETLDRQLEAKEQTLKVQYGELEGAYTRMERLSDSLEQLGRQTNNNR
ncbi:MAG: flagellar filament capping protein FliD [Spirochaetaceae bacterium]|jgi:flagellar hook-associated protein 2|nr:flagellar filament capping protein FliD [Spirochaetaceae bacterium]